LRSHESSASDISNLSEVYETFGQEDSGSLSYLSPFILDLQVLIEILGAPIVQIKLLKILIIQRRPIFTMVFATFSMVFVFPTMVEAALATIFGGEKVSPDIATSRMSSCGISSGYGVQRNYLSENCEYWFIG
jgi:hypothetical protein